MSDGPPKNGRTVAIWVIALALAIIAAVAVRWAFTGGPPRLP